MQLATLRNDYGDESLYYFHDRHFIAVEDAASVFGAFFPTDLTTLLESEDLPEMIAWWDREADERLPRMPEFSLHQDAAVVAPLYRRPRKIWGRVSTEATGPVSFLKPDTALIGPGDEILLPEFSAPVTGEAALAIIIGKACRNVPEEDWRSVVAGFTTALDLTIGDEAGDLVRAKSFDASFSFGPLFLTPDELPDDLGSVRVQTCLNGEVRSEKYLSEQPESLARLVTDLSRDMTLLPGDILLAGTPGSVVLSEEGLLESRIEGAPFLPLVNPVGNPVGP